MFESYEKAVRNLDSTFKVDNAFVDKINQISSSILTIISENKQLSQR